MIGAIKIKDGLFIGDELASTVSTFKLTWQDLEFVVANKVTHVINCAGKQIQNHWEPIGVAYLTFFWLDQDNQVSGTPLISSVAARPQGRGCQRHFRIHRGGTRSNGIRAGTLSAGPKQSHLRPRRLHHAQVQVVAAQVARVPELAAPRPGNQSHFHQLAVGL